MPDVADVLMKDHRSVEDLFAKFKSTNDEAVLATICDELDVHTKAEEEIVYPVIRADVPKGADMVEEAEEEHGEARQIIGRIRRTSDADHLVELAGELEKAVSHHVSEEEDEVFPKLRKAVDVGRLDELATEVEEFKSSRATAST